MKVRFFIIWLLLVFNLHINASEIPIMAFHGVQSKYTSENSYRTLKDAGFNINFTTFYTNDEAAEALDCAQVAGVKILLFSLELISDPEKTVKRFKNHPALFGYYISDEPSLLEFNNVAEKIKTIKKFDQKHPCYINLFPNYATEDQLKSSTYTNYLHQFSETVPFDFISFDNYPLQNNIIDNKWYSNLEDIRKLSLQSNKKFWGFANSTVFRNYRQPTEAGLKLQQYSNLFYGAKGLQYFTYWTLDDENWKKNNFKHSIVSSEGKPTITYNLVKKINQEIQSFADFFIECYVTGVFHTDNAFGTRKLSQKFKYFNNFETDKPALVSFFVKGNKKFIGVLNKDINSSLKLNLKPTTDINISNSSKKPIKVSKSKQYSVNIAPGDIIIINY